MNSHNNSPAQPAAHGQATVPAVSVLMLLYNRPQYMRQAIESVLNQTFRDFEFIILDNGSDGDEVYNIAQEYAAQDSRIILSRGPNLDVPQSRNVLLSKARAEFIALIDDDDYYLLDNLHRQVDFMRANPEVGLRSCSGIYVNDAGSKIGEVVLNCSIRKPVSEMDGTGLYLFLPHSFQIIRHHALVTIGGWRDYFRLSEDVDMFYRLSEKFSCASTNEKLICYRYSELNICKNFQSYHYSWAAALSAVCRRRGEPDPLDEYPDAWTIVLQNISKLVSNLGVRWMVRTMIRPLIRKHRYAELRELMAEYKKTGLPRAKVYLKLLDYSVRYGRFGYWFSR